MPKPHIDRLMAEARTHLDALGVSYTCPSHIQIKIGPVSYYPTTGRVHVDRERGARPGVGLAMLEAVLIEFRLLRRAPLVSPDANDGSPRDLCIDDCVRDNADNR